MSKIILIVFRECLEIALLLGLVLASTSKLPKSRFYIILGSFLGLLLSVIFAMLVSQIHAVLSFMQNEVFEASVMIFTSAIIMWTIIWIQGHNIWIKSQLNSITKKISFKERDLLHYVSLSLIVTITVLREGAEIVLFVYGAYSAMSMSLYKLTFAFTIGGLLGFMMGTVMYYGLMNVSLKYVFKISSFLLILVSASLSSEAASKLTSAGIINILNEELWNSSWLVSNSSIFGKILSILTGYDPKPNALQIIFYLTTIVISFITIKIKKQHTKKMFINIHA